MLDIDGYPTDWALATIQSWPHNDAVGCLDYASAMWHWPEFVTWELTPGEREVVYAEKGDTFIRFATGGWSGNESIIQALEANRYLWMTCWVLSTRGGLHIFRYPQRVS